MVVARILLGILMAMFFINRFHNALRQKQEKRVYQREFRYRIILLLAAITVIASGVYIASPSWLEFAQLRFSAPIY